MMIPFARPSCSVVVTLALGMSAGACRTTAPQPVSPPFTGEIEVRPPLLAASAFFNDHRVIGPTANLERGTNGRWTGWIRGQPVVLTLNPDGKLTGVDLEMTIEETPEGVSMHAIALGARGQGDLISIHVTAKELFVRAPPYQWSPVYLNVDGEPLWGKQVNYGTGVYGGAVTLRGEAASLHPPEPQFALAMLGAF